MYYEKAFNFKIISQNFPNKGSDCLNRCQITLQLCQFTIEWWNNELWNFDVSFQIYVEDALVQFFNLNLISRAF